MAMQNVFNILVDLKVAKTIPQPLVTQNDSVVFILEVMDNGIPFDLAETTTISLAHTRKDQSVVVTTGTKVGNIVTFVLGTNETAVGGSVTAKAQFYDATGRVSTLSFSYQVGLDPTGAGYVPSEVEQTLIQVFMSDAQAKIDELSAVDVVELSSQLAETSEQSFNQTKQTSVPYNYQGAVFSFVDDDGTNNFWNTYKAIFEGKGVRASLGVVSSFVGTGVYMTLARLQELQTDGHEILSHSVAHDAAIYKSTNDLSLVTDATIEADLKNSQQWLIDNGFKGYDTLVFPWGGFGAQAVRYKRLARKYYKYAMDANGTHNTSPVDNMYLKRYFLNANQDFTTVLKPIIDAAVAANGWLILGSHAGDTVNLNGAYLTQVIDYIQSLNVPILPFREASKFKGNALSVGEFTDTANKLYVGNDGKTSGIATIADFPLNVVQGVYPNTAPLAMDAPITSYPLYKLTATQIINTADTFSGEGGTILTFRGEQYYHYQILITVNSGRMYTRRWKGTDAAGTWDAWVASSYMRSPISRYNTSSITTYSHGVEYTDIPSGNATGFPEGLAGTLITYRNIAGDIYSYQDYHIRGTNKRYSRYWDLATVPATPAWSPWVKISAV